MLDGIFIYEMIFCSFLKVKFKNHVSPLTFESCNFKCSSDQTGFESNLRVGCLLKN